MEMVRAKSGAAIASDFVSAQGSPVVLDTTNGRAYMVKANGDIVRIGPMVYDVYGYDSVQSALTAAGNAGGGVVYLPAGTYDENVTVPNYVGIAGDGQSSILRPVGNNFAISFSPGNRSFVTNMALEAPATQSAGGAIDWTSAGSNIRVDNIYLGSKLFYGLHITPGATAGVYYIDRIRWNGVTNTDTAILLGDGSHLVTDIYLSNLSGTANSASDVVTWVKVKNNVDSMIVSNSIFYQGGTGGNGAIVIGENATGSVTGSRFNQVIVDLMDNYGINIPKCRDLEFNGCSVQTCDYGIAFGANAVAAKMRGGIVQNCVGSGVIAFAGASFWELNGVTVSDNNTADGAFGHGIDIAADVSDWRVVNCTVGNFLLGTGHQKYGLALAAGASDNYIIQGNVWDTNETGGLSDGGSGANKVVADNLTA